MKRKKILHFILVLVLSFLFCHCNQKIGRINYKPNLQSGYIHPSCGDSVIWHIHFLEGFSNDTIQIVYMGDAIPSPSEGLHIITNSNPSLCTNITFACFRDEGEIKLFVGNMPYFNMIFPIDKYDRKNLKPLILINGDSVNFESSLEYYRFFGINRNSEDGGLSGLKQDSCFSCL